MDTISNGQRNYFTNLLGIALADNQIDPSELNFLYELGLERGFTQQQIDEIIANPHRTRFEKPKSILDAIDQLYDLVRMLWRDGSVHLHEVELIKSFARRFDIQEELIDELADTLIEQVKGGVAKVEILNEIKEIL